MDAKYVEYCRVLLQGICEHSDDIKLDVTRDDRGVLITATLHKEDMGAVIGRQGQTINAVRLLLKVAGSREEARVALTLNEPDGSPRDRKPE